MIKQGKWRVDSDDSMVKLFDLSMPRATCPIAHCAIFIGSVCTLRKNSMVLMGCLFSVTYTSRQLCNANGN